MNSSLAKEDLKAKRVLLYFTSNTTWTSIPDQMWPQISPSVQYLTFGKDYSEPYVNLAENYFNNGQKDVIQCLTNLALQTNCSVKCHLLSSYNLPACNSTKHFNCIVDQMKLARESDCYLSRKFASYKINRVIAKSFASRSKLSVEFYVGMWSMIKEVKEEIEVLSTPDLIGSVGGSLGMFFGISITTHCSLFLKKCWKNFEQLVPWQKHLIIQC